MATYPNKAMFSKRPEICSLLVKLLKICQGWVDPHAVGAYGQYGDELKIKKNVLTSMYPDMCDKLTAIFGDNATATANLTCPELRRELNDAENSTEIFDILHKYAKENLLWLNVYVKDSFATRIIRDERMTRTSFVANVGGLLGLCMGFSLVSVAEICYFILKRNSCKQLPPPMLMNALRQQSSCSTSNNGVTIATTDGTEDGCCNGPSDLNTKMLRPHTNETFVETISLENAAMLKNA